MDSIDLRDAFFDGLYDLMVENENIIILTADHGVVSEPHEPGLT